MDHLEKIFWNKRIHQGLMLVTVFLYLAILAVSPAKAEKCVATGLSEVKTLLVPIIVAILMGGMVKNLISGAFPKLLGKGATMRGVLTGEALGSVLPPCPFVSYPIIKCFNDGGASYPATMAMLVGLTSVGVWRMFAGLVSMGPTIEGLRIMFSFPVVAIVDALYFYLTRARGRTRKKMPTKRS